MSLLVRELRDEAANPGGVQRDGDAVGRNVDPLDQQPQDSRLLGRVELIPDRLEGAERLRETGVMVGLKLFVCPMLVFAAMSLVHDIDPRAIAVLSAAMPMGADVCLVASRYDTYVTRSSTAVRSVLTVPLLALVLAEAPIVRCCALLARPPLRVR